METKTIPGEFLSPAGLLPDGGLVEAVPLSSAEEGRFPLCSLRLNGAELCRAVVHRFASAQAAGKTYILAELGDGPQREIRLFGPGGMSLSLSGGFGKYTNPQLSVWKGTLYACYEDRTGKWDAARQSRIAAWKLPLSGGGTEPCALDIPPVGREYEPRLACNEANLLLVSETYSDGRYRLLVRCLLQEGFGSPAEAGSAENNDQSPALTAWNGRFVLFFENSRCLYKDYVYELFPDITIPSFGHGWRIDTKLFSREIFVRDGQILLGTLDELKLGDGRSDGVCTACGAADRLILAYYRYLPENNQYVLRICERTGDQWQQLHQSPFRAAAKKPVSLLQADDTLSVSHLTAAGKSAMQIERIPLPSRAAWTEKPLAEPNRCSVYAPPAEKRERFTVPFGGRNYTVFYGDLHMHSNISPCSTHHGFHCSEIEDKYRLCADLADLDFAMCTDHDPMSGHDWARTCEAAEFSNDDGVFVAFCGYEWTSSMYNDGIPNYGHQNVLYRTRGPLLKCRGTGTDSPEALWRALEGADALTIPHHTGDSMHPFDWRYHDPRFQTVAEIFNVRGSYEYDGCAMDPVGYGRPTIPGLGLDTALKKGYRLGFTAGGEHEGCGVTMLLAEELTRDALFDALRQRRVYGTSGTRILAVFTADDDTLMGGVKRAESPVRLHLDVCAPAPLHTVRLMKNSRLEREWDIGGDMRAQVELTVPPEEAYYYFTISQQDGELCWTSPIWIEQAG